MQRLPTIALVDKRGLVRDGLTQILKRGNLRNISSFSSVKDLLEGGLQPTPTLVLLGSREPSEEMCSEIRACARAFPDARIVILADSNDPKHVLTAFKAGAKAYLADVISGDALIRSLDLVVMGEDLLSSTTLVNLFDLAEELMSPGSRGATALQAQPIETSVGPVRRPQTQLSAREEYILNGLSAGQPNKVIARQLGVAEATVKVHVKSILRKIGVINRTQAAIWATQRSEQAQAHSLANGTLIGTGAASEKLNGDHPQDQAISGLIDERKLSHDL